MAARSGPAATPAKAGPNSRPRPTASRFMPSRGGDGSSLCESAFHLSPPPGLTRGPRLRHERLKTWVAGSRPAKGKREPTKGAVMPETPTFGRYAEIPYDQMTPEQKEGYDFAVKTRGPLGGPNKIWVHNPKLAKVAAPFGGHFHAGHYSLSEREREIAVVVINSKWHSAYPTNAHERRGKEMGLPA